jgi:hypothetical protein
MLLRQALVLLVRFALLFVGDLKVFGRENLPKRDLT